MTKNTSYHYSIIIPHKNTPRLLERCLCSIPTWDEIQIIIIDDNSNSESVDFSHFPGNGRKNTEILFTKEGKGAGYARNIGLSHARGKWIIFADADDFFTADCFTILNEYMDRAPMKSSISMYVLSCPTIRPKKADAELTIPTSSMM